MSFELQVAIRYLQAKRKQAVISIITVISILGVTAGVAALVIALAINAGFRTVLQTLLLGAQPHIAVQSKDGGGIPKFKDLAKRIEEMPGVIAAVPSVYETVLVSGAQRNQGVFLNGIILEAESRLSELSHNIVKGDLKKFNDDSIVIGKELAETLGVDVGDELTIISSEIVGTPFGVSPQQIHPIVVAIFSSGLYDLDNGW